MGFLRNFRWVIAWGIFIFVLTMLPGNHLPSLPDFYQLFRPDKVVHLFLFGIFVFLLLQSIQKQYGIGFFRYNGIIIAFAIGIAFGILTEYLQYTIAINRSGNLYDAIANSAGCATGLIVFLMLRRKKLAKKHVN